MKQVFPSQWQSFFLRLFTIVLLTAVAFPPSPAHAATDRCSPVCSC